MQSKSILEAKWFQVEFQIDFQKPKRNKGKIATILGKWNFVAQILGKRHVINNYTNNDLFVQGKPFNLTVSQAYAPTSNAEEAEVEWFYEDLQDLLELTPQKDVLFITGDWNAKVGSQETPAVTGKFGLGVRNKAGQRLIEFCQENTLVIANTLFQQHKRRLYTWTSPDGQHRNQTDCILCSQR